jgi:hypothetical protein
VTRALAAPVVMVAMLAGCSRQSPEAQPIVFVGAALSGEEPASGADTPVVEVPSLLRQLPTSGLVAVQPSDLMTAAGRTAPSLVFGGGTDHLAEMVQAEPERVRLRAYPEGDEVTVRLMDGPEGYGGVTRRLVIAPESTLEDRWYSIELRLPVRVAGASQVEGVQVARFRPDSYPVLQGFFAADRDGLRVIEARFSERVSSAGAARWTIEDDEGPVPCSFAGPGPEQAEPRAIWTCDRSEVGTLRVDFGGVLTTVLGDSLRDELGETLTRVAVVARGAPDADGVTTLR